jgi:hypothetical protein
MCGPWLQDEDQAEDIGVVRQYQASRGYPVAPALTVQEAADLAEQVIEEHPQFGQIETAELAGV